MCRLRIMLLGLGIASMILSACSTSALAQQEWWNWVGLVDGKVLVCPKGDGGTYIRAYLGRSGVIVTAFFWDDCHNQCNAVGGVSGPDGYLSLYLPVGLDVTGGENCCSVRIRLDIATGIFVPYEGNQEWDTRDWLSPDMNGDLKVGGLDYSLWAQDWLSNACRSDFNCDGTVDAADYSVLALHWTHDCE